MKNIIESLKNSGVIIKDENHVYIDDTVTVGEGTIIYPNVSLRGKTTIGKNNIIDMNTIMEDTVIGDNNSIISSVIHNSQIGNNNEIGPFAHISKTTMISDQVIIGNFVEVVRSTIDSEVKIKHLSYVGDAYIEKGVNIGAGTIISNYSVKKTKDRTHIKKKAFIGSNSCLVAPITIGEGAVVAAGSTITNSIKDNSLAIARMRQIEKENYYQDKN